MEFRTSRTGRIASTSLIVLLLAMLPAAALTGTDTAIWSPYITANESSLSHAEFSNFFDLSGDTMTWKNLLSERSGNEDQVRDRIFLMDLSRNTTELVSEGPGPYHEHTFLPPISFSGRYIVWGEFLSNNLFVYDRARSMESPLTADGSGAGEEWLNSFPYVDGDRVVWSKKKFYPSAGTYGIVLQNLTTGTELRFKDAGGDQVNPRISGSLIVWTDQRNEPGEGDIYLFDLETRREVAICTARGLQQFPAVAGTRIAWLDYRDSVPAVYLYDLASATEKRLSSSSGIASRLQLSEDFVAWSEASAFDRNGSPANRIVVYDIARGTTGTLPAAGRNPWLIDLDRNTILYADSGSEPFEDGYVHLFAIDTTAATPAPALLAPVSPPENLTGEGPPPEQPSPAPAAALVAAVPLAFACLGLRYCLRNRKRGK